MIDVLLYLVWSRLKVAIDFFFFFLASLVAQMAKNLPVMQKTQV